jgi:hypothetical protein
VFGLRSRSTKLLILAIVLLVLILSVLFSLNMFSRLEYPRSLQVGDRWFYRVVFPDSTSYNLTETVQKRLQINDTDTFEILRDDNQHISTSYLWITPDWHEIEVRRPSIGNLGASSKTTYAPPIEIVHIPLHVGDRWENNSTLTTFTFINNSTQVNVSVVREIRQTVSRDIIRTPFGNLETYRINVESANALYENLWFSVTLGQIVYAKYYNPLGEAVTETLMSYVLSGTSTNLSSACIPVSVPRAYTLVGNGPQVISTWNSAFPTELKISYE